MHSIECDNCGEQVIAPTNRGETQSRYAAVVCVDCNTEWIFIYDDKGECVDCRRAVP
jgi:ribosomal protein S27E